VTGRRGRPGTGGGPGTGSTGTGGTTGRPGRPRRAGSEGGIAAERAKPAKAKRVTAAARKRIGSIRTVICEGMTERNLEILQWVYCCFYTFQAVITY